MAAICLAATIRFGAQSDQDREQVRAALDRYERTAATGSLVFRSVKDLTSALDSVVRVWVDQVAETDRVRRRQTAALLALDLAWADYRSGSGFSVHRAEIIEWGCELLRRQPVSSFERLWMMASYAIMQPAGTGFGDGSPSADKHLGHALEKFPDVSRLRLARLLARPVAWAVSNRPGAPESLLIRSPFARRASSAATQPAWPLNATVKALMELTSDAEVGHEARTHIGLIYFHQNKLPQAIAELTSGAESRDPFVRNLAHLIIGLALEAQKRPADATSAFERAVLALPTAKASATALANRLFHDGRREEASSFLDRAFKVDPPTLDPWQHIADLLRFVPNWMSELHVSVGHPPTLANAEVKARFTQLDSTVMLPDSTARTADWISEPGAQSVPAFRSRTEAVLVEVSVQIRNQPVGDLRGEEIELLDNGVRQQVEMLDREKLPIDLSIVVDYFDAGGSGPGMIPGRLTYEEEQRAQLKNDIVNISKLLQTGDRIRIIQVENEPYEVLPLSPFGTPLPPGPERDARLGRLSYGRNSAIYDAVGAALMRFTPAGRRHVVLVFTEGVDDGSVLTKEKLLALSAKADAVMHLSKRKTALEVAQESAVTRIVTPRYPTLLWPAEPTVVGDVAKATGGTQIDSLGGSKYDDIRRIIERQRQSYVLRYQPRDVPSGGWHEITIRILRPGRFDVQSRKGYWGG